MQIKDFPEIRANSSPKKKKNREATKFLFVLHYGGLKTEQMLRAIPSMQI
jgi:hypothetical protein